jgi:hypothetical protein
VDLGKTLLKVLAAVSHCMSAHLLPPPPHTKLQDRIDTSCFCIVSCVSTTDTMVFYRRA